MKRDLVVCFVQKLDNVGSVDLKDGLGWEWGCDCHLVNMFESSSELGRCRKLTLFKNGTEVEMKHKKETLDTIFHKTTHRGWRASPQLCRWQWWFWRRSHSPGYRVRCRQAGRSRRCMARWQPHKTSQGGSTSPTMLSTRCNEVKWSGISAPTPPCIPGELAVKKHAVKNIKRNVFLYRFQTCVWIINLQEWAVRN